MEGGSQRYFVRMGADLPFYGVSRAREQVPCGAIVSQCSLRVLFFEDTQNAMETTETTETGVI